MLNKENLKAMEGESLEYIVGARLKNLPVKLQKQILNQDNYEEAGDGYKVARFDHQGRKLIVNYSAKRAKKDAKDREKALEKLKAKLSKKKKCEGVSQQFWIQKISGNRRGSGDMGKPKQGRCQQQMGWITWSSNKCRRAEQ